MTDSITMMLLGSDLADVEFTTDTVQCERYSRDFSWFSPVLRTVLASKMAEAVVRPNSEEQVKRVLAACHKHHVPLTLRGSGTGNYGQSTPLEGGVLMDMSRLTEVCWIKAGVARVQAGTRLVHIDKMAQPMGWELRLLPSTYRTSTAGGFFCGGFGGVGSITYGSIGDAGNVIGARLLSLEAVPQVIEVRGSEVRDFYHAYGVNGVITELEFALAPALEWQEVLISFPDFMSAVYFCQALGKACGIMKKLLTLLADPIPQMCGLGKNIALGRTAILTIVDNRSCEALRDLVSASGGQINQEQSHAEVYGTHKTLIERTWNHTTLHTVKKHEDVTYLQSGFRPWENVEKVKQMYDYFGDEVMMHLEFLRVDGALTCSGLQLVRYTSEARLNEIIQFHRDQNVHIANPHTCYLEDGGKFSVEPGQIAMKRRLDPEGLLNPGKMRTWEKEVVA